MIEIFVDGNKFTTLTQEAEWTRCTMLIRKHEHDLVMLIDTNPISGTEAYKMMAEESK